MRAVTGGYFAATSLRKRARPRLARRIGYRNGLRKALMGTAARTGPAGCGEPQEAAPA
jgi:hypothetical protein